ncbi:DNA polymerase III subunit delta [Curvivirga sp.]|uniref:DNA polymerase III subunit delta n=1 Tax=Curvivirga sp. TaxID=2856848 RepID=UPI003B5C59E0
MLIATGKTAAFLKSPDPKVRCILVFGPDEGLVKERFDILTKTVVEDVSDPFLIADLDGDILKSDPARLSDEAAAISMMGGRRVVRIRDVADSHAKTFVEFLENPPGDALIVIAGGDLAKSSKLRQAFEKSKDFGAAIACYADDNRSLDAVIRDHMKDNQVNITADAVAYLTENMGSSRGMTRSELEKLVLYAGEEKRLDLDDVTEAIGDTSAFSLDMAVQAAAEGDAKQLDLVLNKLWDDGLSPVALIRSMTGHMLKIQQVQAKMETGSRVDEAVGSLRPPIFWKIKDKFTAQCRFWGKTPTAQVLTILLNAEKDCKRTGLPPEIITGRALQQIAALARRQRRR